MIGRTGSLLVLTEDGVKRGVGVRRLPIQERWNKEGWDKLRGLPWDVKSRRSAIPAVQGEQQALLPQPLMVPAAERRLYVLAADIKHYGVTDGCLGCESVAAHGKAIPGVGHTQECRSRIEELLSQEVLGRARLERHRRKVRGAIDNPESGTPWFGERNGRCRSGWRTSQQEKEA